MVVDAGGEELVGKIGQVTIPIDPAHPGEVLLPVRGGTEAFTACSDEAIAKHTRVMVVECLSGRTVTVTPFP
jgi:membrane protein implicated in regulation of membrane protease activity